MKHLAKFVEPFSLEQVPDRVVERAKLMILDSIAAITYGNQDKKIKDLVTSFEEKTYVNLANRIPIIGTEKYLDERHATFINAIAMVSYELDEGNPKAKGHPAAHFLPALLAIAITNKLSGKKFLEAFIVNYEISARLGASLHLIEEIHPHGNWGVFGNGFGVGKLLNWDQESMMRGAMISSSFAFPTLWNSVLEGHEVRNVIIGLNNLHTTLLPNLVHAGYSASTDTLSTLYSKVLGKEFNELPHDLGETYYILSSYFKFYAYCRFCHAPIDATLSLVKDIQLDDIKEINVRTYSLAARLDGKEIQNNFAGKFSIPYAIASELYEAYKHTLKPEIDKKQLIEYIMERIYVKEDANYTKQLSQKRITSVEVVLSDGRKLEKEVDRATGDPDEENLDQKIIDKSNMFLQSIYAEKKTKEIIEMILNIEHIQNMETLQVILQNEM